jgi:hypothetical protein
MTRIIRLTESDLTRIVRRVINEDDNSLQKEFKSYCNQKLVPLGFIGKSFKNTHDFIDSYKIKEGIGSTYKSIDISLETNDFGKSYAYYVHVITDIGHFTKNINLIFIDKLKMAVDDVVYFNNLIDSALKINDKKQRLLSLEQIKKTLIEKGFDEGKNIKQVKYEPDYWESQKKHVNQKINS